MDGKVTIDMSKYGKQGMVVMSEPGLKRARAIDNAVLAKQWIYNQDGSKRPNPNTQMDVIMIRTLGFIESAPFPTDLDGFLDYTDSLDKEENGKGTKLYGEILKGIESIRKGEVSPFPNSPEAVTGNSD